MFNMIAMLPRAPGVNGALEMIERHQITNPQSCSDTGVILLKRKNQIGP
jgi:hypothetical protein